MWQKLRTMIQRAEVIRAGRGSESAALLPPRCPRSTSGGLWKLDCSLPDSWNTLTRGEENRAKVCHDLSQNHPPAAASVAQIHARLEPCHPISSPIAPILLTELSTGYTLSRRLIKLATPGFLLLNLRKTIDSRRGPRGLS